MENNANEIDIKETIKRLKSINTHGWVSHRSSIYIEFYLNPIIDNHSSSCIEISATNIKVNNREFARLLIDNFRDLKGMELVKLINSKNTVSYTHLYWLCTIPEINKEITRIKKQAKEILNSIQPDKKQIKKSELKKEIIMFLKYIPGKYKLSDADLSEILSEIANDYLVRTVMNS